jgi:CRP/FNR family transcriptional regulator, cyclic AMP receptor protein
MTTFSTAAALATTDLFGDLGAAERERVAERMRPATFTTGQLIFSRGDDARELYLLQTGRVRLSMLSGEGREIALAHAMPGGIFGEIAVLDGGKRTAFATALSAASALSLSRLALLELMVTTPSIAQSAITFLCRRLRDTDHQIEAIALHPIEVRIARFLLAAVYAQDPKARGTSWPLTLGISQSEIALLVGASRPKVNAALTQLEDIGAIQRDGTRILCDIAQLTGFAVVD